MIFSASLTFLLSNLLKKVVGEYKQHRHQIFLQGLGKCEIPAFWKIGFPQETKHLFSDGQRRESKGSERFIVSEKYSYETQMQIQHATAGRWHMCRMRYEDGHMVYGAGATFDEAMESLMAQLHGASAIYFISCDIKE